MVGSQAIQGREPRGGHARPPHEEFSLRCRIWGPSSVCS